MWLLCRTWAARVVQILLVLGVLARVRTTVLLIQERRMAGQTKDRLAIILGSVAVLTAGAALLLKVPHQT
ncbi:MAG: hypothetical protein M1570_17235 [Chloroflexi bacterium]|nr:hypothetical protein [Chloroflexota bacterium]